MLYDIIQITEGAEIKNASVAVGDQFPTSANLGELFFYDPTFGDGGGAGYGAESVTGLYIYRDDSWNKIRSGTESSSSNVEYIIKRADASAPYAQAIENLNTGILQYSGNNGNIESGAVDLENTLHITGQLSPDNFPGLTGDVSTSPDTFVTTLADSGVVADSGYTKFNVDSRGRIIDASKPTKSEDYYIDNVVTTDSINPQAIVAPLIGNYASYQAPTNAKELVTKQYVDNLITGLDAKQAVRAATTSNIVLSGLNPVDGVTIVSGDRVLVKDQTLAQDNGVYLAAAGVWTRTTDALTLSAGAYFFVTEGATNGDSGWLLTTDAPIVIGTTALTFVQFTGTGQITAGAGLSKTGNILNIGGTADRIMIGADNVDIASTYEGQPSISTLGVVTSGTWHAGKIDAIYGGTGFSTYTVGNILYADTPSSLAKLTPNATATTKFLSQASSGAPTWNSLTDEDIPATLISKTLTGSSTWNGTVISPTYGGTGLATTGSANTILSSTGSANEYRALSSDNGVGFVYSSGSIKINTPQDLRTTANPSFNSLKVTGVSSTQRVLIVDATNEIQSSNVADWQLSQLASIVRIENSNLPALVNNFIDLGYYDNVESEYQAFIVDVMYGSASSSIVKRYEIVARKDHTGGAWQITEPVATTGANGGVDFNLEIKVTTTNTYLRIRKTLGSDSALFNAFIMQLGGQNDFTTTLTTGTDNSVLASFDVRNVSLTNSVTGTLGVVNGGTGISSYSIGDLLFANSLNTLTTLPASAVGNVLLSGTSPTWGKVNLTSHVSNILPAAYGGTGISSYTVGDLLVANSTSSLTKVADVAVGNVLLSGGVGAAPAYGKVSMTAHISGITPLANGGTNANLTANPGAIVYSTPTEFALSAVGGTGHLFQSNGMSAPSWVNPSTLSVGNATNFNNLASSDFMRSNIQAFWAAAAANQQFTVQTEAGLLGSTTASNPSTLRVYQPTFNTDAFMVFENFSDNRVNFGIDGVANDLFVGGGTLGAVKHKIYHAGNTAGAITSILNSNLTANRALVSDGSGKVATATATTTELNQLSGVTGLVPSINPSTPRNGDIQTDTTNGIIRIYLNGAWKQVFPAVYS